MNGTWRVTLVRALVITALALALLVAMTGSAVAITGDYAVADFEHPFVCMVVIYDSDGEFAWRGSGSLISPDVVLTAGHVADTVGGAASARVYFQQDAGFNFDPATGLDPITGYPMDDYSGGVWSKTSHQLYNFGYPGALVLPDTRDVGVLVLDEPVSVLVAPEYGELPKAGELDSLASKRGQQKPVFTVSGYGLSKAVAPNSALSDISYRSRLMAQESLVTLTSAITDGYNVSLQGNGKDRGGTCFGDSGGPAFLGGSTSNLIVGVTSFGMNELCAGTGYYYRIDRQPVLDWIEGFLD